MKESSKIIDRKGRFAMVDTAVGTYAVALSGHYGSQQSLSTLLDPTPSPSTGGNTGGDNEPNGD